MNAPHLYSFAVISKTNIADSTTTTRAHDSNNPIIVLEIVALSGEHDVQYESTIPSG